MKNAPALFSVAEAGRWKLGALTGTFLLAAATNDDDLILSLGVPERSISGIPELVKNGVSGILVDGT